MSKKLTDKDFYLASKTLKCQPEAIKAVARVESGGRGGFDSNDRLLLRFEGHHFRRYTNGKFDKSHPQVSYPYSVQRNKQHGYSAFNEAFKLNPVAAMLACSFGMFQVLGIHFDRLGFNDVHAFVDFMKKGEAEQLEVFIRFIRRNNLTDELQRLDFAGFAKGYNGASYKDFNYDGQMLAAYKKEKAKKVNWSDFDSFQNLQPGEIILDIPTHTATAPPAEVATDADPQWQGLDEKQINSDSVPATNDTQIAENINIGSASVDELKDKAIDIARDLPPIIIPETKSLRFHTKILGYLGGLFAGTMAFPPILESLFSVEIALKLIDVMVFVLPYLIPSVVLAVVAWYAIRTLKEYKKLKLQIENNTRLDTRDFRFVSPPDNNESKIRRIFG